MNTSSSNTPLNEWQVKDVLEMKDRVTQSAVQQFSAAQEQYHALERAFKEKEVRSCVAVTGSVVLCREERAWSCFSLLCSLTKSTIDRWTDVCDRRR